MELKCLEQAINPVVLSSFGKDSLLILYTLSRMNQKLPVIWFGNRLSKQAERVIQELELTMYNYPPADQYIVEHDSGLTLISEYSVGGTRLPMLNDIVVGEGDLVLTPERMETFQCPFDVALWGYKKSDSHPIVNVQLEKEMELGSTRLVAPLYDLTDEQVFQALDEMSVEYDPDYSDDITVDADIFAAIQSMEWDGKLSLNSFRLRFGLPC